jgi:broad specificity phosphatase PhoE
MSRVYLIRHGQAGLRQNYDILSDLGRRQAESLGTWMKAEGISPDRVISGSLNRQIQTAEAALPGVPITIEPRLAEFDLDAVYRELAPGLCQLDADFKRDYEAMLKEMSSAEAPVHRQWNSCDVKVFLAWQSGRWKTNCESWADFKARVQSFLDDAAAVQGGESVAVFTSATPIGLLLGRLWALADEHAMRLAGAHYNSGVTTLRVSRGDVSLMGFNSVAHLGAPELRTHR